MGGVCLKALLAAAAIGLAGGAALNPFNNKFAFETKLHGGAGLGVPTLDSTSVSSEDLSGSHLQFVSLAHTDPLAVCAGAAQSGRSAVSRHARERSPISIRNPCGLACVLPQPGLLTLRRYRRLACRLLLRSRAAGGRGVASEALVSTGYSPFSTQADAASRWLVMLGGSTFCYSAASCAALAASQPALTSSVGWAASMTRGGVFDVNASKWGAGNRAYVRSCSADLWLGDLPASSYPGGVEARGHRIVLAVLASLVADQGLGNTSGASLLWGGCEGGAIGALASLEEIAAALPGVSVSGFFDSGLLVDIRPTGWAWSDSLIPLQTLVGALVFGLQPALATSCYALSYIGQAAWKCFFPSYRLPLITKVPFFVHAPQFPEEAILYDTGRLEPVTPPQLAFVATYQQAVLNLIAALPPGSGVFSPSCLLTCLSASTAWAAVGVDDVTIGTALEGWFVGASQHFVADCTGWPCTAACGVTAAGAACMMVPLAHSDPPCSALALPTSSSEEQPPSGQLVGQAIPGDTSTTGGAGEPAPPQPQSAPVYRRRTRPPLSLWDVFNGLFIIGGLAGAVVLSKQLGRRVRKACDRAEITPLVSRYRGVQMATRDDL